MITQVNGKALRGAQDLLARIAMLKPGQPMRLRLWRRAPGEAEGQEHNVRIEVDGAPAGSRRHALVLTRLQVAGPGRRRMSAPSPRSFSSMCS